MSAMRNGDERYLMDCAHFFYETHRMPFDIYRFILFAMEHRIRDFGHLFHQVIGRASPQCLVHAPFVTVKRAVKGARKIVAFRVMIG